MSGVLCGSCGKPVLAASVALVDDQTGRPFYQLVVRPCLHTAGMVFDFTNEPPRVEQATANPGELR